ncbi:MAG: bifunctional diguanylate cyclase/phosphodiesterase [Lachnospiraceae bacterium]|nr:bifunctional diguanylate cyclase/phosphodiesterase [Lachnospiraceae bacterium]
MDESLSFQVDLLKSQKEKLEKDNSIQSGLLGLTESAWYYINFKESVFQAGGAWKELFGVEVPVTPDREYLSGLVDGAVLYALDDIMEAEELRSPEGTDERVLSREIQVSSNKKWLEGSVKVSYDESSRPVEKYVCFKNITRYKAQYDELTYMAYYDEVTGLYNRNYFVQRLTNMVRRAGKTGAALSLVMIELLDYEKMKNSVGIINYDELLQSFGVFLQDFVSDDERIIAGHLSAQFYAVAIYDSGLTLDSTEIIRLIRARLKNPFVLSSGDELSLAANYSIANYPESGNSAFLLLEHNEFILFSMAEKGLRNSYRVFDSCLMESFMENITIEKKIENALRQKIFQLYYQPQYNIRTGKLRGCEALIRWPDTDGVFVSPAQFIPIAEKSGAIYPIGRYVLEESFSTYARWKSAAGYDGIMSINISALQIRKNNFVDTVLTLLKKYNLDPDNIEIEITETAFIENTEEAIDRIGTLRGHGVRVALDDFGTGYSSLSYLKNLPIDTLKIDKTFMDTVISDNSTGIITESLVRMVQRLGLETIAEGVENREQYEFLKKIQCDNIQGFLLGRPMPEEEFRKMILSGSAAMDGQAELLDRIALSGDKRTMDSVG